MYYQASALNGENVDRIFLELAGETLTKTEKGFISPEVDTAFGVKKGKNYKLKKLSSQIQLQKKNEKIKQKQTQCLC